MATKVSIDAMADAIMKELNDYADTTADGVKAAVQKAAKTVKSEIQSGAPVKSGKYQKSWSTKNTAESSHKLEITVYANKDYTSLADEIDRIREKKQRLLVAKAETAGYKKKIEELKDFINESADELTDYDESLVRKYIKEIRIFDDRFQVFFKAGVDVEIAR